MRTFFNVLIVVPFLAVLYLPFIQMQFSLFPDLGSCEKRELAAKPDLKHLGRRTYEAYFNDNFGFRNVLVRLSGLINIKMIRVSPTARVVLGNEGWLFYGAPDSGISLKDHYNLASFTVDDLSVMKQQIARLREELASRNILLIVVIAPNKQTIYSERLPLNMRMMKGRSLRLDQIVGLWGNDSENAFLLDLRAPLINAKRNFAEPLFYKTDTHWNDFGAFIAYSEIVMKIRRRYPSLMTLHLSDFRVSTDVRLGGGDLSCFINLSGMLEEVYVRLNPLKPYLAETLDIPYRYPVAEGRQIKGSHLPRLLVFGDSFITHLIPYLSESFSQSLYLQTYVNQLAIIERERPDVVIFEFLERNASLLNTVLKE